MMHKMKLDPMPFGLIRDGKKTVELRLNDEKRRLAKVGDLIEFTQRNGFPDRLVVRVTALHGYPDFASLFAFVPCEKFGLDEPPDEQFMDAFYPKEKQAEHGALGIEFRLTDLQRFVDAQENGYDFGENYETALSEIRNGEKISHWMWYVFPQMQGLGNGDITRRFAIRDIVEAEDYMAHPVLAGRLQEISGALLKLDTCDPMCVFGLPDAFKLRSCMTLFSHVSPETAVFRQVLDKFCCGIEDEKTLDIIKK